MEKDTAKIVISKALKRWFKSLCTERDTDMSAVVTELVERWCLENGRSMTIAQLVDQNRQALSGAGVSLDAIASGEKPSRADLVKISTAIGIRAEILQAIYDRSFNGQESKGGQDACR